MHQLTVNGKVSGRLSYDGLCPIAGREIVLALDLLLSAIHSLATSPHIDVVDARASTPVGGALGAVIFKPQVLARVWIVDDLTLCELAGRRGKCQGIGVGARAASLEATATVVSGCWTWRIVSIGYTRGLIARLLVDSPAGSLSG